MRNASWNLRAGGARPIAAAAALACLTAFCHAGARCSPGVRPQDAPATRGALDRAVQSEPLAVELGGLAKSIAEADATGRKAALERMPVVLSEIRRQFPEPTPLERRLSAGWDFEKRTGIRALVTAAFKRIDRVLASEIESDDRNRRNAALSVAGAFAEDARSVLPLLARRALVLDDDDVLTFAKIAEDIGGIEAEFVPAMAAALAGSDPAARKRAALAVEDLADESASALGPTVAGLGRALEDPDEETRDLAAYALQNLGAGAAPARDALRKRALAAPATASGMAAAVALTDIDASDTSAVPGLTELLGSGMGSEGYSPRSAADRLRRIGPPAAAALPKLVKEWRSKEGRLDALRAIAAIDVGGAVAVPLLIEASAWARDDAALAVEELVRFAGRSPAAFAWLESALAGVPDRRAVLDRFRASPGDPLVVFDVFRALFEAAPGEQSFQLALRHVALDCRHAVPLLAAALGKDDDSQVLALASIPMFGVDAAPVLPRVREILRDGSSGTKFTAIRVLQTLDPEGTVAVGDLVGRLADANLDVSTLAIAELGRFGRRAASAAPALARLAAGAQGPQQEQARVALAQVGGDNRAIVAEAVARLLAPNELYYNHWHGARDLARLEPAPLPPVESLSADLAREKDTAAALHALLLLARHHERAKPSLPLIIARLRSPTTTIRIAAAIAIGEIGPDARDAVPALCEALDATNRPEHADQDDPPQGELRDLLVSALASMGPAAEPALRHLVMIRPPRFPRGAIGAIEASPRPPLTVKTDPNLVVGGGRWREVEDGRAGTPRHVAVRIVREARSRRIVIEDGFGYAAVHLYLERQGKTLKASGTVQRWSMDTAGWSEPITGGTIVLDGVDFGSGRPVRGLVTFTAWLSTFQVAFTCRDPFVDVP